MAESERPSRTHPVFDLGGPSAYDDYVRFSAVLDAIPAPVPEDPPDNMLFRTVHLLNEFTWYNIHYELGNAADCLDVDDFRGCARLVRRAQRWQSTGLQALELLDRELSQERFLEVRRQLPAGGSGLDSPGYKNLWPMASHLWERFLAACSRSGTDLDRLAQSDFGANGEEATVALVADELLELDKELIKWQHFHVRLVWSKLGGHPATRHRSTNGRAGAANARSMTGRPVDILDGFTKRVNFPQLWALVNTVYDRENSALAEETGTLTHEN